MKPFSLNVLGWVLIVVGTHPSLAWSPQESEPSAEDCQLPELRQELLERMQRDQKARFALLEQNAAAISRGRAASQDPARGVAGNDESRQGKP